MNRTGLTASFLRSFVLLIVIPILIVLSIALGIMRSTTLEQANQRILLAQESVAASLETEIRDMELVLAHFILVNQEQAFTLVSQYDMAEGAQRASYAQQLTQLYNMMLLPRSNIVALHFYMKSGAYYGLKDDLAVPVSTIRETKWYQDALALQDRTMIDVSQGPVTYVARQTNINNRPIFTVAYAPGPKHRYDRVEVTCLYFYPQAIQQIATHTGESMGVMMLLDDTDTVLFDGSRGELSLDVDMLSASQKQFVHRMEGKTYSCFVTPINGTAFRLVSAADQGQLLEGFAPMVWIVVGIALFIFALFGVFSVFFFNGILRPVNLLIAGMRETRRGDLSARVQPAGRQEMRHLLSSFNRMMEQIETLMRTIAAEQEEKRQQEVRALQAQINPHFLFNTLSSICFIARIAKFDSIGDMTEALMQIMRYAFKEKGSFYTVAEELKVLKSYILLMQIRYAGSFEEAFDMEEASLDCLIPRFTLQPVVENAIVHGFENKEGMGLIRVSAGIFQETLRLSVWDNGRGMTPEIIEKALSHADVRDEQRYGIGIPNVQRRIALHYGSAYGIAFESDGMTYTCATVTLPILRKEAE